MTISSFPQVATHSQKHSHPSNWSGYMLFGKDIILKDRAIDLSRCLRTMIQTPDDYLIAALKTLLAMVRSHDYHVTIMCTTLSIDSNIIEALISRYYTE